MGSRALEAEIDRLYQLPLDEFTPARNAVAKGAGGEAARVRALSKPPVAAWAVNQLYWRKAEVWNALLAGAENAQRVQRAVLAGRAGDVRAASKVHEDAVEKTPRATLALLASFTSWAMRSRSASDTRAASPPSSAATALALEPSKNVSTRCFSADLRAECRGTVGM